MTPEKRPRPKRSGIETEEERTWVEFYRRVRQDPALAAEVLAQLERDIEMKRDHLALYLSCKEALRLEKARQVRHRRIGLFVRWMAYALFVLPWQLLREFGGKGRDIAIEMLPDARQAPSLVPRSQRVPPSEARSADAGATQTARTSRKARPAVHVVADAGAGTEKTSAASS